MPANRTVSNNTEDFVDTEYNFAALIFGVLLIVVIICGNLLVCLSVYTEKALKTTTNYFIVSLAVADLMLAVLVLPLFVFSEFQGGVWSLTMTTCDSLMTMDVMLCTASIFNLCAISIDRFIAVSIPLNYNRKHVDHRQVALLLTTWVLACAVASPVVFGVNDVPGRAPGGECKLENGDYVLYSSVCSFFIPCPIMLLLYCGMFRGLRRWEEARKAKLRNSIQACRKLQEAAAASSAARTLPPLASLPPPLPPIIEREQTDNNTQETVLDAPPPLQGRPYTQETGLDALTPLPGRPYTQETGLDAPPPLQGRPYTQETGLDTPLPLQGRPYTQETLLDAPPPLQGRPYTQETGLDAPPPLPGRPYMLAKAKRSPVPAVAFAEIRFAVAPRRRKRAKINGRERKAMKVLPVVVGAFLFCWSPFFVVHTLRARCSSCQVPPALMSVVTWLGYVNSALNPVIYTVFNAEFRNFFKKFLRSCCCCCTGHG